MAGCSYWQQESKMSEEEKLSAITISERMLYFAKQDRKQTQKKSNITNLKKNIGLKEVSVCKDSPIKISTYKKILLVLSCEDFLIGIIVMVF